MSSSHKYELQMPKINNSERGEENKEGCSKAPEETKYDRGGNPNERWEMASETKTDSQHIHFPSLLITAHSQPPAATHDVRLRQLTSFICLARMSVYVAPLRAETCTSTCTHNAAPWARAHLEVIKRARQCESVRFRSKIKSAAFHLREMMSYPAQWDMMLANSWIYSN